VKALKFFTPKENFLVLNVASSGAGALLLGVGKDKTLVARSYRSDFNWSELATWPNFKRLFKNVIIAADSSLAYTATIPVVLDRENPSDPLTSSELENLMAQAVGRVFNSCRAEAGKYLGVDDLEVILVGSRVVNFKIDGHQVLNPLDFSASRVETVLELTLTVRHILDSVKTFLKGKNSFYFTEIARAELAVLGRREKKPVSLLYLDELRSVALCAEPSPAGQVFSRRKLNWHAAAIWKALAKEWGLSPETAHAVYRLHLENGLSSAGSRSLDKFLTPVRKSLLMAIDEAKPKGRIFLDSPLPLFLKFPLRRGRTLLEHIPVADTIQHFGFELDEKKWLVPQSLSFRFLAPFLEYYYDRSDTQLNRWLKRHLNWLGAPINSG